MLDLFSGVGSFGLECLSRGSSYIIFVENYKEALSVLKKNISNMGFQKNTLIIEKDIIESLNFEKIKKKIDIIFMDPPYKDKNLPKLLIKKETKKILI